MATVLAVGFSLAACTGDDEPASSLPLPDKPPSARGPATGPDLEPKVLLAATDDLESTIGAVDTAQVARHTGALVSGQTVVGYSVDDISGYNVKSGEKLWTAKLDLEGGTVCFASQPDRAVTEFVVVYGESDHCSQMATIRVDDGKVLAKKDFGQLEVEVAGESLSLTSIERLFTVKGRDYLLTFAGDVLAIGPKVGKVERIATLEARHYFKLDVTPDGKQLIGSRLGGECQVDAYSLPSFKHIWTKTNAELFPDVTEDCAISAAERNPSWLTQEDSDTHYIVQVDPKTGDIVGRAQGEESDKAPKGELDVSAAALYFDTSVGTSDGDMIFAQPGGISRYSMVDKKFDWELDLSQFELDSDYEFPTNTVLPQAITKDGYLVVTVSNITDVDVAAVDVATGKLVGRWPLPDEYRNGFQVNPGAELFDGGIVLRRNFRAYEYEYKYEEQGEPKGDKFDLGVFAFPEPNAKKSSAAVPTAGPVETEASWIGGVKHVVVDPDASSADSYIDIDRSGTRLISRQGRKVRALNTSSGKTSWTAELPPGADVCAASDLDGRSRVLTLIYRASDKQPCSSLVRLGLKKGTKGATVKATGDAEFANIISYRGRDFVIEKSGAVGEVKGNSLAPVGATLRKRYTEWGRTPEDPSLLIASVKSAKGKDIDIDAYRLPTFEPVWSTTASTALGRLDAKNPAFTWPINALYVTTTFGDENDPDAKIDNALAHLDPKTGKVSSTTGKVRRDFSDGDDKKFSLTHVSTSYFFGAGFSDGSVLVEQDKSIMRYNLDGDDVMWATNIASIRNSMERDRADQYTVEDYELIDGGKSVLVAFSNDVSVEFMTMKASDGTITGRWKAPKKYRNGLQTYPAVTAIKGGVAMAHSAYSWNSAYGPQSGQKPPAGQLYDIGLFGLKKGQK